MFFDPYEIIHTLCFAYTFSLAIESMAVVLVGVTLEFGAGASFIIVKPIPGESSVEFIGLLLL